MKNITKTFKFTGLALVITASLTACNQEPSQQTSVEKATEASVQATLTATDAQQFLDNVAKEMVTFCLLYTSPSPRD